MIPQTTPVNDEWNKLVKAHTDAVSAYEQAVREDANALQALEAARVRAERSERAVPARLYDIERALGALLKHAAATGKA